MKKTEQLYFEDIDATFCHPLDCYTHDAKLEGKKEITLLEAIPDLDNKKFVWCTHEGEVAERQMCKKAECPYYYSKSGRGVCEYRGKLYNHGNKVIIKLY